MATTDHPAGTPCWFDLMTSDIDASTAFYEGLFGWEAEPGSEEHGGYVNFRFDGARVAGAMAKMPDMAAMPDVWSVYLATDDADATVAAATEAGGTAMLPVMDVGDLGRMAVLGDPDGAAIGLWQSGEHTGFVGSDAPGTPSWFELHTRSYAPSVAFYADVFGLSPMVAADEDDFRYTVLQHDGTDAAGVMDAVAFLPEGVPSHWSVYIQVADADATLAKATELGGTVLMGPDDTPYGVLATIQDPTGAVIKIQKP